MQAQHLAAEAGGFAGQAVIAKLGVETFINDADLQKVRRPSSRQSQLCLPLQKDMDPNPNGDHLGYME
jgi:hypothetical protein